MNESPNRDLLRPDLDRSRRYLVPVNRLNLDGEPDDTHWSVFQWLESFQAWATGPAICGYSTSQGALPDGTAVTCPQCQERRPDYERMLAPGYRPEGTVPNPPGSTCEQIPADVLALLPTRHYLSTACETGRLLQVAIIRYPDREDLPKWQDRMHGRCRLNNKFTGAPCTCRCHQTSPGKQADR